MKSKWNKKKAYKEENIPSFTLFVSCSHFTAAFATFQASTVIIDI